MVADQWLLAIVGRQKTLLAYSLELFLHELVSLIFPTVPGRGQLGDLGTCFGSPQDDNPPSTKIYLVVQLGLEFVLIQQRNGSVGSFWNRGSLVVEAVLVFQI